MRQEFYYIMKKLFGTDGMRGEAGSFPLTEETIKIVGSSLTRQFREKTGRQPNFITGRDTRESGEWIEKALHQGIRTENAECSSAGVITTPGVAFLTGKFGYDAGIVISASHNPFQDNGIKIFFPDGKKLDGETERAIESDIYNAAEESFENEVESKPTDQLDPDALQNAYIEHLAEEFSGLSLNGLKIVIDCANGAASELAPKLFGKFGAETVVVNAEPNGKNINENCGSLFIDNLRNTVLEEKADFGVAFDGDADRALFVDERGDLVDGDATLWIMANFFSEKRQLKENKVVATVMSNIGLELALKEKRIELLRTPVGDKYVLEELLKHNLTIGGEQSGHIIFAERSLVGDGMMTSLHVLNAMTEKRKPLSAMVDGFVRYPQILVNVRVREKLPFESVPEIAESSRRLETSLNGNGRLLLRYSGTENLARVMIEGSDQNEIESQANSLAAIIKRSLG